MLSFCRHHDATRVARSRETRAAAQETPSSGLFLRMLRQLRHRLARDERGIALLVALAALLAVGIAVTAVISYTTSNQRAADLTQAEQTADQIAESGIEQAYSIINYAKASGGTKNPASPDLLGCAV